MADVKCTGKYWRAFRVKGSFDGYIHCSWRMLVKAMCSICRFKIKLWEPIDSKFWSLRNESSLNFWEGKKKKAYSALNFNYINIETLSRHYQFHWSSCLHRRSTQTLSTGGSKTSNLEVQEMLLFLNGEKYHETGIFVGHHMIYFPDRNILRMKQSSSSMFKENFQ